MSGRTIGLGCLGIGAIGVIIFMLISTAAGGHMAGFTHIDPGNVGLVIDTYSGNIEPHLMPAGYNYQGPWETVIDVPTVQRAINLTGADKDSKPAIQVNTPTNILTVEVSCQYHVVASKASNLYSEYQEQFEDLNNFESINLEPAVKEAINYAIGDMDTATALTTAGKQAAENAAIKTLNDEWLPQGIEFSQLMIRGIDQDQASKDLLSTTLGKMQEIQNAKLALQQQIIDNQQTVQQAQADAKINNLINASLTPTYMQDLELGQTKQIYINSNELTGGK